MKTERTYFSTQKAAYAFAELLPKQRFEVKDFGKDPKNKKEPYYVEYLDMPTFMR